MPDERDGPSLSPRALELLGRLFATDSNLQLPVGVAEQVVEIRAWVQRTAAQS